MKKLLFVLLLFLCLIKVSAYENEFFTINIPDNYKLVNEADNSYKWKYNNNYVAISYISNDNKYDIKDYTEEDINKQKENILIKVNEGLSNYNIKATITSIKKDNKDNLYYLEYDLYLPSKKISGFDIYQKGRIYSSKDYFFTIIYNCDKKIDNDEYNNIMNTFSIKTYNTNRKLKDYLIVTIIIGVISGIIGYFVSLKKEKQ